MSEEVISRERVSAFTRDRYLARKVRLIHSPCMPSQDYRKFYNWLVNDWIVNQPDSADLMHLFIEVGFDVKNFMLIVTGALLTYVQMGKNIKDLEAVKERV